MFEEFGQLGTPIRTTDVRSFYTERTFKERVYFEKDAVFSSGASAQAKARSANFSVTDETGWGMDGAGNAWFYGTTTLGGSTVILADLYSSDWDGSNPANLATRDSGATKGYYLDHSAGAAQFVKLYADTGELRDMDIRGNITLGASGVFRSAASGQRVEITAAENDMVRFYSGGSDESSSGRIFASATSNNPYLAIWGPTHSGGGNDLNSIILASEGYSPYGIDVTSIYQKVRLDSRGDGAGGAGAIEFHIGGNLCYDLTGTSLRLFNDVGNNATSIELGPTNGTAGANATFIDWHTGGATDRDFRMRVYGGHATNAEQGYLTLSGLSVRFPVGSSSLPGISFISDPDTGIYSRAANQIGWAAGGTAQGYLGHNLYVMHAVYNATSGSAANIFISSGGQLVRSTSAARYKKNIEDADWLADIKLQPAEWKTRDDDVDSYFGRRVGLIADQVAKELPEAGIWSDDWDIEDYDVKAVLAVLAAKVNRLERQAALA